MLNFIRVLLLVFTTLLPVVNPLGGEPIFYALTRRYTSAARLILARKIALYSFTILAVSLLFGPTILGFFGISLAVIQIAGGLVLAGTGWNLLNQKEDESAGKDAPATTEDALAHAFFPLTLPITVGPGCISIAVTIGAHLRHEAAPGSVYGIPLHLIAALIGMLLLSVLVWFCYWRAEHLVKVLGRSGTNILLRLSAFILFSIGVQIMWNGLISGIPQVLTTAQKP